MPSNANLNRRLWCALILGLLALLALAARGARAQSVRIEFTNITRDAAFDGLVAWTGPARDRYPAARHDGRPAKELADLSRSLPAAPLAALLNAQPGVTAVHREGMVQPGETVYVTVPARHGGWRVALPLAGEDGYAWAEGEVSPETPSQDGLAHAWDAGSVAWVTIHSARRAPVARWRSEWRRSRPAGSGALRPPGGSGGDNPTDPERVPDPPRGEDAPPRNMTCNLHDLFPDPTACAALDAYKASPRGASWRPGGKYHPVSGWACRGSSGPRHTSYSFYHDGASYRVRLDFDCP